MAKRKKVSRFIRVLAKVSIPRAGEFFVSFKIDMADLVAPGGGKASALDRAKPTEIKKAFAALLDERVREAVKVTPFKGELVKAESAFQMWRESIRGGSGTHE